ncbi:MAG: LPS export ABC transporter permease LptF [Deltaproteobacteria bacterium]|nr:LPS export ABC transporter permease LptF [Deltaproteobacteria bacterium]
MVLPIMNLTINKYIINEIWPTFLASLFVSVFIILATKMLSITELIVSQGVHLAQVIGMVVYLLPDIIAFALPAATLIAVVVAFLRLSGDNEVVALQSSGVSLYQMLSPVVVLSFFGLLIALMISVIAVPWGNRSFRNLVFQIAESKADLGIKEHVFCEPFDEVVFYVNSFSGRERVMKDVFVVDRRDRAITNTIIAEEGRIFLHLQEKIITLRFLRGTIFAVGKDHKSARTIGFKTYDLNIGLKDIMDALASREKDPKEMSIGELGKQLKTKTEKEAKRNEMMIEFLERFSIPLAVFFMGIIGAPLGAQMRARGRSEGIGVSLVVFFSYYICLAGMRSVCETGFISPSIGMWFPDLFLLFCCIYLLRISARQRSLNILSGIFLIKDFLDSKIYALKRKWKGLGDLRSYRRSSRSDVVGEQLSLPLDMNVDDQKLIPDDTEKYVGNVRRHKFHRPDCRWAKKISQDNTYSFKSRDDAVKQGYIPCEVCDP